LIKAKKSPYANIGTFAGKQGCGTLLIDFASSDFAWNMSFRFETVHN